MSTLDLNIIDLFHGDTPVLKVMKGDVQKWPYVPYDAEVEYLESSGTQYINTFWNPSTDTVLDAKYMTDADVSTIFTRWSGANAYDTFGVYSGNSSTTIYYGRFSSKKYITLNDISLSSPITLTIGINQITINGATYSISRSTFSTNYPIWLFGGNNMGDLNSAGFSRIYYLKIYRGDTITRDYIPVRKDGVGYLYDKVSGNLFGNAGTGDFTLGPDK